MLHHRIAAMLLPLREAPVHCAGQRPVPEVGWCHMPDLLAYMPAKACTIATPAIISIICRLFKLHATNVRLKLVVSQLFVSAASLSNAHWPAVAAWCFCLVP